MDIKYVPETLTEAKQVIKGGHGPNNPELTASDRGPLRSRIFNFLKDRKEVNEQEFQDFLEKVSTDRGLKHTIKVSSFINRNKGFIETVEKEGTTMYKLTTYGDRVLKLLNKMNYNFE